MDRVPDRTSFGRYQDLHLVGEGGAGLVYRAYDSKLHRTVALKLLRHDDAEHLQRLLDEARAQACLEHDHVCKVYDVDQVEGQAYIAMQYVAGTSIDRLRDELNRETQVKAMAEIAAAVHSAHKVGVIHRDIKPHNILVERDDDGRWHPYILDFGIAHRQQAERPSGDGEITSTIIGTPAYMSPEQARGHRRVDRRCDVYSLGSTLYALLTGRSPFSPASGTDLLIKIVDAEPVPLRRLDPTIPRDLEAIVLQCLEKDPDRRYQSARALAEDLQRFLDGLPVRARQATLLTRIGKAMRRHRALSLVVLAALLVCLGAAGLVVRARVRERQRTGLAHRLAGEVAEMEQSMRLAALLPLHDIRPQQEQVRQDLERLEQQRFTDSFAQALLSAALGRGYLLLQEPAAAIHHLETAYQLGFQPPELHQALGTALVLRYRDALQAMRFAEPELRQARLAELRRCFKEPALLHLKAAGAPGRQLAPYLRGLIALCEDRADEAVVAAQEAVQAVPWRYEAHRLEGDAHLSRGLALQQAGQRGQALAAIDRAGTCYAAATAVAHSDVTLYEAEANRLIRRLQLRSGSGEDPANDLAAALTACSKALQVDPDRASIYETRASIHLAWAEHLQLHGVDPAQALDQARSDAEAAIRADPDNPRWQLTLGATLRRLALAHQGRGGDPSSLLQQAVACADRALALDPLYAEAHCQRGACSWALARYQREHGIDPGQALREAAAALDRAARLAPQAAAVQSMLGNVFRSRAMVDEAEGRPPQQWLQRAEQRYRQAVQLAPEEVRYHNNLGNVLQLQAEQAVARGDDPSASIDDALTAYRSALTLDPSLLGPASNLALVLHTRACHEMANGVDAMPTLVEALSAIDQVLARSPGLLPARFNRALLLCEQGRYLLLVGQSAQPALAAAEHLLLELAAIDPDDTDTLELLVSLRLLQAEQRLSHRQPAGRFLVDADQRLTRIAARDQRRCRLLLLQGKVASLQALQACRDRAAGAAEHLERALQTLTRATACAQHRCEPLLELARCATRCLAADPGGVDRASVCRQGIEATDQALQGFPGQAEALVLRSRLRLWCTAAGLSATERQRLQAEVRADHRRALQLNRFLAHQYGLEPEPEPRPERP